jgi:HEAT repeat protein
MKRSKPNIQGLAKKKNVPALIKVLNDSDWDTSIRIAAVSALGEFSDLQAVEALIEALKDKDADVRQAAAATLGQLGYTRAVEPLVAALEDNTYWVREQAAVTLGQLGWQPLDEIQSALLAVAKKDWNLAVSLGPAALAPLIAALRDTDSGVRDQAAAALGKLGDTRALEPLVAALRDTDSGVRVRVAAALGQLGDTRAVELLMAALEDNEYWVRGQAA